MKRWTRGARGRRKEGHVRNAGLVARKTLTPTLSQWEREQERIPDEIWDEALARVEELDAGSR